MLKNICAPAQHFFQKPNFAPFRLCVELLFFSPSLCLSLSRSVRHLFRCRSLPLASIFSSSCSSSSCHFLERNMFQLLPLRSGSFRIFLLFLSSRKAEHMFPKLSSLCAHVCVCVSVLINWFRFGSWSCGLTGLLVCALVLSDWWVLGTDCGLWPIIKAA